MPQVFQMKRSLQIAVISVGLTILFSTLYLSDLAVVPFHPDESSQIYMSRDFDTLILERNPSALAWTPDQPITPEVKLRLLDAPMTKYWIGLGWWLRGHSVAELNVDWVWGAPWDANLRAIPSPSLLLDARAPIVVLGALATVLLFWLGVRVGSIAIGMAAALLLGLDPLSLLHARRAMAESALTFFSLLAVLGGLWLASVVDGSSAPRWRTLFGGAAVGALAALAMASKQTELVMLPLALLASGLPIAQRPWPLRRRLKMMAGIWAATLLGCGLAFWLLNPILMAQPLAVAQQMIAARVELAASQVQVNGAAYPDLVLASIPARLSAVVAQLYWQPPSAWDVPVYLDRLQPPAQNYLAVPWHTLLRQTPFAIALAILSLIGLGDSARRLVRSRFGATTRAEQIVWLWGIITLALIALTIPLNWQRYFMPLLPVSRLFAAMGLIAVARWARLRLKIHRASHARAAAY